MNTVWTEAHLWAVLSAPFASLYACAAALNGVRGVGSSLNMKSLSWTSAACALAAACAALTASDAVSAIASAVFVSALAYLTVFDLLVMAVPIWPTLVFITLGLVFGLMEGSWETALARGMAAVGGFFSFRILDGVHKRLRGRSGLGAGDALIAGLLGAWMSVTLMAWSVAAAGVLALVWVLFRKWPSGRPFPFAPALAAGACVVLVSARMFQSV